MTNEKARLFSKHIIPFDIGITVTKEIKALIEDVLNTFPVIMPDRFWRGITIGLFMAKQISPYIELYLYEYGVGVFVVRDREPFCSDNDFYAYDFCTKRSTTHNDIYLNKHVDRDSLNKIMADIWNAIRKYDLRKTASPHWELNGISYAMPIDFLEMERPLRQVSEEDRKNFYVILNPSLIEKEDAYSKVAIIEDSKYINFDNFEVAESLNDIHAWSLTDSYQINDSLSVYVSWSTLLVCYEKDKNVKKITELFTCLQVELQAFWFYTYILSLMSVDFYHYKAMSRLKNLLFDYHETVEKFKDIEVSKLPNYLSTIWEEMMETSYLEKHIDRTTLTLQFLIERSDKAIQEKQYKFMKINNLLILSIAYVQIIPFLYNLMIGNHREIDITAAVFIGFLYMIIVVFTWKRE